MTRETERDISILAAGINRWLDKSEWIDAETLTNILRAAAQDEDIQEEICRLCGTSSVAIQ